MDGCGQGRCGWQFSGTDGKFGGIMRLLIVDGSEKTLNVYPILILYS
jgi:hypothetical protein